MGKRTANRVLLMIILMGVLAIGYIYFNYSGHARIGTVQVSRETIVEGVSLSGVVKAQKQANIGFENPYPATITKLFVKAGDTVKAGTMLAQLENAGVKAAYDQAWANVSSARLLLGELSASVKMEKLKLKDLHSNTKKVQAAQVTVTEKSVGVQGAALLGAQAGLKNAEAQLVKMTLKAPFDGIIAKQDVEVGDLVAPGMPIATLMADKDIFEIQMLVSEQDIAKMKIGDTASVTLDAYGDAVVFSAQIEAIDPGETIQNGVSVYKVTLVFEGKDNRIKSGMNANVLLKISEKPDALAVPREAIINHDGKQFVLVSEKNIQQEKEVSTGMTGVDGMVEIISGLSGGEYIAK